MTLIHETNLTNYISQRRGLFYTHLLSILEPRHQEIDSTGRSSILDTTSLIIRVTFRDHSNLQALETLKSNRYRTEVITYGYQYERESGFYFHYEMEQLPQSPNNGEPQKHANHEQIATQIKKPHYHLHVGAKRQITDTLQNFPSELGEHTGPHYATPVITLDHILAVIITNYFPDQTALLNHLQLEEYLN